MKLLYVGPANIVGQVTSIVRKKYSSTDTLMAQSLREVNDIITRGEVINRVIIFDNIIDLVCKSLITVEAVRKTVQDLMTLLKADNVAEYVVITRTKVNASYFLEELYDRIYAAVVINVGTNINATTCVEYSIKAIKNLKSIGIKNLSDCDIYEQVDDVVWSDSQAIKNDYINLDDVTNIKFSLTYAFELLDFWVLMAIWEYKSEIPEDGNKTKIIKPKAEKPNVGDEIRKLPDKPPVEKKKGWFRRLLDKLFGKHKKGA